MATTSSGLTDLFGFFTSLSFNSFYNSFGIRELNHQQGWLRRFLTNSSLQKGQRTGFLYVLQDHRGQIIIGTESESFQVKRSTQLLLWWMLKLIWVEVTPERSFKLFQQHISKHWRAILSVDKSIPFSFLNSATMWSIIFWSKPSPPSLLSPRGYIHPGPHAEFKDRPSNVPHQVKYQDFSSLSVLSKP